MMRVFLTVDTEISLPLSPGWEDNGIDFELERDILGRTPEGDFGITFQMDVMKAHGWKGVFFVESLFACATGIEPLRKIVAMIQERGHEVQLHLHTEWLSRMRRPLLGPRSGTDMLCFSREDQVRLLEAGLDNLRACGVRDACAFRAGNLGVNQDTLEALRETGIVFDSSAYPGGEVLSPGGILEVPITFFNDFGGHFRPMQVCACSIAEMKGVLLAAWREGWPAVVIVSHGFELLKRPSRAGEQASASRIRARRFEELCRFLGENRDKFMPQTFRDLDPALFSKPFSPPPLRSPAYRTAWRYAEQMADRVV